MVDSKQVEITFFGGIGRQREPGFGALAQIIGRIATPILHEYIVLAAKRMGADLLETVAPEFAKVDSGRKKFETAAKSVGKQTLRQQLYSVTTKKAANRINPTKTAKKTSLLRRDVLSKTFLNIHVDQFSVPTFCGNFWKSWRENPSS